MWWPARGHCVPLRAVPVIELSEEALQCTMKCVLSCPKVFIMKLLLLVHFKSKEARLVRGVVKSLEKLFNIINVKVVK